MSYPPPSPGPGYPPPPPGYGQPPGKKPIYKKWWFWVGVVIVLAIIGSALPKDDKDKGGDPSTPPAAASQPAADPATTAPATTAEATTEAAPETTAAPEPTARTVFNQRGTGIKDTKSFTVTQDEWDINYTYNCSNFGQSGNFQIYLYKGNNELVNIVANALDIKGKDTTTQRESGRYYMKINSVCDWTVKVVG